MFRASLQDAPVGGGCSSGCAPVALATGYPLPSLRDSVEQSSTERFCVTPVTTLFFILFILSIPVNFFAFGRALSGFGIAPSGVGGGSPTPGGRPLLLENSSVRRDKREHVTARPLCQPAPLPASDIFAIASSMVKEFGLCIAGKSLKVSANFAAAACANMIK
jgi:hypothetical protein